MRLGLQYLCVSCCVAVCWSATSVIEYDDVACMLQAQRRTGSSHTVTLSRGVNVGMGKAAHEYLYYGSLSIGTPKQSFLVAIDTGSGNLILPGDNCNDIACLKHHRFDHAQSSTFKEVNCAGTPLKNGHSTDKLRVKYGTGQIKGKCVQDDICMGELCAPGTFMASLEETAEPFSSLQFDGVLGLALDKMAQGSEFSMMGRMVRNKLLMEPLFSVFLSDSDTEVSELTFGEIKKEHMASELFWVPVNDKQSFGYWEVLIDDITFDDKKQGICKDCRVAVDTGASQLAGPSDVIANLRQQIGLRHDCSNMGQMPRLGFAFGKNVLNLSPNDYVDNSRYGGCSMALMDLDVPPPKGPLFVLGIPFLQKFFTVYDHANMKIGFAVAKHDHVEASALSSVNTEVHQRADDTAAVDWGFEPQ